MSTSVERDGHVRFGSRGCAGGARGRVGRRDGGGLSSPAQCQPIRRAFRESAISAEKLAFATATATKDESPFSWLKRNDGATGVHVERDADAGSRPPHERFERCAHRPRLRHQHERPRRPRSRRAHRALRGSLSAREGNRPSASRTGSVPRRRDRRFEAARAPPRTRATALWRRTGSFPGAVPPSARGVARARVCADSFDPSACTTRAASARDRARFAPESALFSLIPEVSRDSAWKSSARVGWPRTSAAAASPTRVYTEYARRAQRDVHVRRAPRPRRRRRPSTASGATRPRPPSRSEDRGGRVGAGSASVARRRLPEPRAGDHARVARQIRVFSLLFFFFFFVSVISGTPRTRAEEVSARVLASSSREHLLARSVRARLSQRSDVRRFCRPRSKETDGRSREWFSASAQGTNASAPYGAEALRRAKNDVSFCSAAFFARVRRRARRARPTRRPSLRKNRSSLRGASRLRTPRRRPRRSSRRRARSRRPSASRRRRRRRRRPSRATRLKLRRFPTTESAEELVPAALSSRPAAPRSPGLFFSKTSTFSR